MEDISFDSFQDAGQSVLRFLYERFGFSLWMITRVEGDDWIVLQTEDHGYDVNTGHVFKWADSFCSHMVSGAGPKIAPCSDKIPLYANAPIAQQVTIKAYIGQPLTKEDGSLFGTLCAIDPELQSEALMLEVGLIELLGDLLSRILQTELREMEQKRKNERLQAAALRDSLTGLFNRRAWDELVLAEEERCQHYGHPAAIFFIDLNGLKTINDQFGHSEGDKLIQQTANTLLKSARPQDIVARLGGDEFAILTMEDDLETTQSYLEQIFKNLKSAEISAAIGYAIRSPLDGLQHACIQADKMMYQNKAQSA